MKMFGASWLVLIALIITVAQTRAADEAPANVRQTMPQDAISLRWQKQSVSQTDAVWLHLYCKPSGRSDEAAKMFGLEKRSAPITREEITPMPGIKTSPFWLDVWQNSAQKWQRLSSARYMQDKDVNEIVLRWLDPKAKTGPILLLNSGFTHWHEWDVFTYANGWQKTPAHQTFFWGGEGGSGISQRFDQTRNGRTVIVETESEDERESTHLYRWDGREWNDATQKFFLIGATTRTRAEAEKWRDEKGWGEVLRSDDFSNLKAGYYIAVLERFRSLKDANERARLLKKDNAMEAYVRRALP